MSDIRFNFKYDINYRIAYLYEKYDNDNNMSFEDFKYWYIHCQSRDDERFFDNLEQRVIKEFYTEISSIELDEKYSKLVDENFLTYFNKL